MGKQEKLSPAQIEKLVSKLREEYRDYIIRYQKPFSVQNGFEHRYLQARQYNVDLEGFLRAEIEMLLTLKNREEEKSNRKELNKGRVGKKRQKSFADKIIEQMEMRISGYPEAAIHEDASYEMKKLFGALELFRKQYWNDISYLLRGNTVTTNDMYFRDIDTPARDVFVEKGEEVPPLLRMYVRLLSRRPRDWEAIDKEEKRCIIEVAFFLHNIAGRLDTIKKNKDSSNENQRTVESADRFILKMIEDFRLADINPQNLGGARYG